MLLGHAILFVVTFILLGNIAIRTHTHTLKCIDQTFGALVWVPVGKLAMFRRNSFTSLQSEVRRRHLPRPSQNYAGSQGM